MLNNPYTPGAGCIPAHLAGREELIEVVRAAMRGKLDFTVSKFSEYLKRCTAP